MPKKKTRKRCRCNPDCYRFLGFTTRQVHYQEADPDVMLDSDVGSESAGGEAGEGLEVRQDFFFYIYNLLTLKYAQDEMLPQSERSDDEMEVEDHQCRTVQDDVEEEIETGSPQDIEDANSSDTDSIASSSRTLSDFGDLDFDEEDWGNPDYPSLDEMYEELRDILGSEQEKELWELSMIVAF